MIVCLCRGVSDRTVRALIVAGARTPGEVKKACGAGTDCGKCGAMLTELFEGARGTAHRSPTGSPYVSACACRST